MMTGEALSAPVISFSLLHLGATEEENRLVHCSCRADVGRLGVHTPTSHVKAWSDLR